jgi:hypothetical protein
MTLTTGGLRALETAVVDANVLYSHHQRNIFMTLGVERLFALRRTEKIEREWFEALLRNRPDLSPDSLRRTIEKMNEALPDARIDDYGAFENLLVRTDPEDRHVAAAAMKCAPATLVTWNLHDFDVEELQQYQITTKDPDFFLCEILDREPIDTFAATIRAYSFLKKQDGHPTWAEYLEVLERNGLPAYADRLRQFPPTEATEDSPDIADLPSSESGTEA